MENKAITKTTVWAVFDRISPTYDRINRVLSLGLDTGWRQALKSLLPKRNNLKVVDLATGTGDVILTLAEDKRISSFLGLDLAQAMMEIGKTKAEKAGIQAEFRLGDAEKLPLDSASADVVSMAFGIRNVSNTAMALSEIYRILKPEGKVLILEFSLPGSAVVKGFYLLYLRYILPVVGGLLSRNFQAYRYLNRTIEEFPSGEAFLSLLKQAGFKQVKAHPMALGAVSIYEGNR